MLLHCPKHGRLADVGTRDQIINCRYETPRYSVAEVKRAFADQGIKLYRVAETPGRILLSTRSFGSSLGVQVAVETRRASGPTLALLGRVARHGNVMTGSGPADRSAVRAALQRTPLAAPLAWASVRECHLTGYADLRW
jgi:hypothetical protein